MSQTLLKDIRDRSEIKFMTADGFDSAVIGVNWKNETLIYSVKKCIDILVDRDGMSRSEADEFIQFNVVGAHMGDNTPTWCDDEM